MNATLARLGPPVGVAVAMGLFLSSPAIAGADRVRNEGPLVSYSSAIPAGATARVQAVYDASGNTVVTLHVWGLSPNTEYGAHAHVNPCGLTGLTPDRTSRTSRTRSSPRSARRTPTRRTRSGWTW